jgi:hypothetical protein
LTFGEISTVTKEELYYRRSAVREKLSYLVVYATGFPTEDRTSLKKEQEALLSYLDRYEREFPSAVTHPRYALFKMELDAAFEAAASGASGITRLFQIAADRFSETLRPPTDGPDFVASPSGITKA